MPKWEVCDNNYQLERSDKVARHSKPTELSTGKIGKEEIEKRKAQEEKLRGSSDLVYDPPKHLSKQEKELYIFLVEELRATGILNNLDITILETTVDAIAKMKEANKLIKKHGLIVEKADGTLQRNPASTIYKDYNSIFNKCCMEIGLSPSARARLSVINVNAQKESEDPLLAILAQKKNRSDTE